MNKVLMFSLFLLFSNAVLAKGYWDYREICDYEPGLKEVPWQTCFYEGDTKYGYHTAEFEIGMLQPCADERRVRKTVKGTAGTYKLFVTLPLVEARYTPKYEVGMVKVEGSCRTEKIWVTLCPTCNVP